MTTLTVHFDGKVLVPDQPVSLPLDQPLHVTVETLGDLRADTMQDEIHRAKLGEALKNWRQEHQFTLGEKPSRERTYADNPRLR